MVEVAYSSKFKKTFKKIISKTLKSQLKKQIMKIIDNPTIGKPMKFSRKGTRELYISPFRLSYIHQNDTIILLDLYHKDTQ